MTLQQYKNLKKLIDKMLQKAENEALEEGIDLTSPEFEEIVLLLKKKILANKGLTLEQYEDLQKNVEEAEEIGKEEIGTEGVSLRLLAVNLKKDQRKLAEDIKTFDGKHKEISKLKEIVSQVQENQLGEDDIKKLIPKIPKIKDYGKDIKKLEKKVSKIKIPEQIDNTEQIDELKWKLTDDIKAVKKDIPKPKDLPLEKIKKELKDYIVSAMPSPKSNVSDRGGRFSRPWGQPDKGSYGTAISDSRYYKKEEVDALISAVDVLEIDLSSQCDGSETDFTLGRAVKAVIVINLEGTNIPYTLNAAKNQITLTFAPSSGESLKAITLI